MRNAQPLNADLTPDPSTVLAALSAYVQPGTTSKDWGDPSVMERHYARRDEIRSRIASELIAAGAEPKVAELAANGFVTYGFAPSYGLGDPPVGMEGEFVRAKRALDRWVASKLAAYSVASDVAAQRVRAVA